METQEKKVKRKHLPVTLFLAFSIIRSRAVKLDNKPLVNKQSSYGGLGVSECVVYYLCVFMLLNVLCVPFQFKLLYV